MRTALAWFAGIYLLIQAVPEIHAHAAAPSVSVAVAAPAVANDDDHVRTKAFRSGRGGFRSPRMGFNPGNRARNPGFNNPRNRAPAAPAARPGGFLGGLFGGFLAGSLLGSLLNPFGFGNGAGGFSLIGLIFWGVILYLAYRLIRRLWSRER